MKRRFFAATVGMCLFFGMGILFMAPLPVFAWEEDRVEVGPDGEIVIYKNLYRDVEAFIESIEDQEKKALISDFFHHRKPTHGVSSQEPYKPMTVDQEAIIEDYKRLLELPVPDLKEELEKRQNSPGPAKADVGLKKDGTTFRVE